MVLVILFFITIQGVFSLEESSLRVYRLEVPTPVWAGNSVELKCNYDLGSHKLYTVKWYKDGEEFFRYVPQDTPNKVSLHAKDVKVDVSLSTNESVYLPYVELQSAGEYRCEISAESPDFTTAADKKYMDVFVDFKQDPEIKTDFKNIHKLGDIVVANCSSGKSKPPAKINWFINDAPTTHEHKVEFGTTLHNDSLITSHTSLTFKITDQYLNPKRRFISLRCSVTIPDTNKILSTETSIKIGLPVEMSPLPETRSDSSPGSASSLAEILQNAIWKIAIVIFISFFRRNQSKQTF